MCDRCGKLGSCKVFSFIGDPLPPIARDAARHIIDENEDMRNQVSQLEEVNKRYADTKDA